MRKLFFILCMVLIGLWANAAKPIELVIDSVTYKLDPTNQTASVVYGNKGLHNASIRSAVDYDDKKYVVNSIGLSAFEVCREMISIEIPTTIDSIAQHAFYYCTNLRKIEIPNEVKTIGFGAFGGCSEMTSISLPNCLSAIEGYLFYECTKLKSIIIPDSVDKIGRESFAYCENLEEIWLPKKLTYIGDEAFLGCKKLSRVNIPDLFAWFKTKIESSPFIPGKAACYVNNELINHLEVPTIIEYIPDYLFIGCSSIVSIITHRPLKKVGKGSFKDCDNLKIIDLCASIEELESYAFANCLSLEVVAVHAETPPLLNMIDNWTTGESDNAFTQSYPENMTLHVPEGTKEAYEKAEGWKDFGTIIDDLPNDAVPTESISLDKESAELEIGESITLIASVLPENATDKTVTWTTEDATIATVDDNGNVIAMSLGQTNITASNGDHSASCVVKVVPTLVQSIQLAPEKWEGIEGESFKIEATVMPENATDKSLVWTSSDDSVAIVGAEGNVTVLKEGSCVIKATAKDGSGVCAECIITSVAGVDGIFTTDDNFDIYGLNGYIIKENADKESLKLLTPGIYLVRHHGEMKKLVLR